MTEWGISTGTSLGMFKYQIPFGVFLLFFAAIFPLSGQLLEKLGPKKQGIIGGIIVAAGWILASSSPQEQKAFLCLCSPTALSAASAWAYAISRRFKWPPGGS